MLIYLLVVKVQWFPSFGMYTTVGGGGVLDLLKHLALPAVAGSAVALGIMARTSRSAMLEVLRLDFMTGLRAKGLSEPAVWRHAFRNALPPITTMVGLQLAYLMLWHRDFCRDHFLLARHRAADFYCGFQSRRHDDPGYCGGDYCDLRIDELNGGHYGPDS